MSRHVASRRADVTLTFQVTDHYKHKGKNSENSLSVVASKVQCLNLDTNVT